MAQIAPFAFIAGKVVPYSDAHVSIGSSAVLYGLSIYTVFFVRVTEKGSTLAFRLPEHYKRLVNSARMIGMDDIRAHYSYADFYTIIADLVAKNRFTEDHFVRVTIHAVAEVAGVRTSGLTLDMSIFAYKADPIVPGDGARIKTSLWRRTADHAIPARAKVNGAYVNSSLAKQDAIDAGYDDCLFLNQHGFVSELSAANVMLVKDDIIITPDVSSDILEGITRKSIIALAQKAGMVVHERKVALTEIYTADEVFACGTSAFVAPIINVDARVIGTGACGTVTARLRSALQQAQAGISQEWTDVLTEEEIPV